MIGVAPGSIDPIWVSMAVSVWGRRVDADGQVVDGRLMAGQVYLVPAGFGRELVASQRATICSPPTAECTSEDKSTHPLVDSAVPKKLKR